jgi:hypothetical protein
VSISDRLATSETTWQQAVYRRNREVAAEMQERFRTERVRNRKRQLADRSLTALLTDQALTRSALHLYGVLDKLAGPRDAWIGHQQELRRRSGLSERAVISAVKALHATGWIRHVPNVQGRHGSYEILGVRDKSVTEGHENAEDVPRFVPKTANQRSSAKSCRLRRGPRKGRAA